MLWSMFRSRSHPLNPLAAAQVTDTDFIGSESCQSAAYCIFHISASQIRQPQTGLSSTFLPNTGRAPLPKPTLLNGSQPLGYVPNLPIIKGFSRKNGPVRWAIPRLPPHVRSLLTADSALIPSRIRRAGRPIHAAKPSLQTLNVTAQRAICASLVRFVPAKLTALKPFFRLRAADAATLSSNFTTAHD